MKFKNNFIYNAFYNLINILYPIVSFPYVARVLGSTNIGEVQFVISICQYFILFSSLGIPFYGIREVAKVKESPLLLKKVFSELVIISFASTLIISLIFFLIFSIGGVPIRNEYILLSELYIFLSFCNVEWLFNGLEKYKWIAARSFVVKICVLISTFIFVKNENDFLIFFLLNVFTFIGTYLITFYHAIKDIGITFNELNLNKHFSGVLIIFSTSLSISVYTILDIVILGYVSTPDAVAYYSTGLKLDKVVLSLISSFGFVLIPKASIEFKKGNLISFIRLINNSIVFIIVISIPISCLLFFLANELIILFSGSEFILAAIPMKILSILPLIIGINNIMGMQVLIPTSNEKILFKFILLPTLLGVVLNIFLSYNWSYIGTSISTLITELLVTISLTYIVFKKYNSIKIPLNLFLFTSIVSVGVTWLFDTLFRLFLINQILLIFFISICSTLTYTFLQYLFNKNLIQSLFKYE